MLGKDPLQKNSGGCLVPSGKISSPQQTSIDKTNVCVTNSERSALAREYRQLFLESNIFERKLSDFAFPPLLGYCEYQNIL